MATIHERAADIIAPELAQRVRIVRGEQVWEPCDASKARVAAILEREYGPVLQQLVEALTVCRACIRFGCVADELTDEDRAIIKSRGWINSVDLMNNVITPAIAASEAAGFTTKGT